ncbi:putative folylpolyglutamate synthase [unidentified eubacterium SCB49]|nr:putative folylpolyglutamate synthase [unidentified eubacterium SCB49]
MTYSDTLKWMFQQLPMYQRTGKVAYKADLSNTVLLVNYLQNPENSFKSIHVAGTNGKGSTSHMMASILQEAGYKVGLYTSPHLKDFRERIKINGIMIPKRRVSSFITKNKSFFELHQLSFFEMTVGLAFDYFSKEKVDIAIIEVGLGGRLDSTNVIKPEVSVITNIGLDHTQFLGNTHKEVATEKAGIIKNDIPVVIGETTSETLPVFTSIAAGKKAPLIRAEIKRIEFYPCELKGNYQFANQRTARAALKQLDVDVFNISEENIKKGLKDVVKNTGLMGRWQVLNQVPKVICDTAHNKEGLSIVLKQLQETPHKDLHIVLGFVNDKDVANVLKLFPKNASYYFCEPKIPRAMKVEDLFLLTKNSGLSGKKFKTVKGAYRAALKSSSTEDLIFIGGSTFVVAEVV